MSVDALRFLADESCDFGVVRALRAEGYDFVALSEITSHTIDSEVIAQAYREKRILLTEDKDFGQLVFASQADDEIQNAFVVVQPSHTRVSRGK